MARRTKKLESTAYHEAGHAVVAFELEIPVESVTIAPDEESVGSMIYQRRLQKLDDYGSISARRRATLEAHVRVLIAGWIAEKRFNPKGFRRSGAQEDQRTLITIVFLLSNSEKEARLYHRLLEVQTVQIVNRRWFAIKALAAALLKKETLSGEEAGKLIMKAFQDEMDRAKKRREKKAKKISRNAL